MPNIDLESIRLDKWLWIARFYKTRKLAADAVSGGKIHLNKQRIKPGKEIKPGAILTINKESLNWEITVLGLAKQRLPAKDAVLLYEEDPESITKREKQMLILREQRTLVGFNAPEHKPNKKDRRLIHQFKQF